MRSEHVSVGKNGVKLVPSGNARGRNLAGNRKEILSVLFRYPASSVSRLAREMKLTPNTVKWHLAALLRREFINEERFDNRSVYYPVNFVDRQEIQMLSVLNDEEAGSIFCYVFNNAGKSQKEIKEALKLTQNTAGYFLRKLAHAGLLEEKQDGKFKFYYPSENFMRKFYERSRRNSEVISHFISKLRSEGYEVNETYTDDGFCILNFRYRRLEEKMLISLNPFRNIVQRN
jgi:DNA-binding MarR family transcriptional regulator